MSGEILQTVSIIVIGLAVLALCNAVRDLAKAVTTLAELHEDEET